MKPDEKTHNNSTLTRKLVRPTLITSGTTRRVFSGTPTILVVKTYLQVYPSGAMHSNIMCFYHSVQKVGRWCDVYKESQL